MAEDGGAEPMMARAVLLASVFALIGIAAAPSASASDPCVVGNEEETCAVSVYWVVCVTEPCDPMKACVGYGRVCTP